jgi:alanyl-tRNA synthetase
LGREDNWWPAERWEGPCGPCSEIHLDLGPEYGCNKEGCTVGCDCDRYLEIWNLVFQMYTEAEDGTLTPLPASGIDTGMGLERLAIATQGVKFVAETDEMAHIMGRAISVINDQTGGDYAYGDDGHGDLALRIITDHLRAAAFTLAGGVVPSNEGAGYVLRRFIRRAFRYGRQLGATEPFLYQVIPAVAEATGQHYSELVDKEEFSAQIVQGEEERFAATLRQGLNMLDQVVLELQHSKQDTISGEKAFTLYDTYGFPVEMTVELAAERGLKVDMDGFSEAMAAQRVRSGKGSGGLADAQQMVSLAHLPASAFVGYDSLSATSKILGVVSGGELIDTATAEGEFSVILDQTPFYAEQGGQVGDEGLLDNPDFEFAVTNTVKHGDKIVHLGRLKRGTMDVGDEVSAAVDAERRGAVMRNHTATHLLHAALREVIGDHVSQSGSLVAADRLRFDFTHHEAVTHAQLKQVERLCNLWIVEEHPVSVAQMDYEDAIEAGALAIFTEKYDSEVRTVATEGVGMELCGGTHCETTGQIGSVHILSESSVAAGIRRIEAVSGTDAAAHHRELADRLGEIGGALSCKPEDIIARVEQLREQTAELRKQLEQARSASASIDVDSLEAGAVEIGGVKLVAAAVPGADRKMLGQLADELAARLQPGVAMLGAAADGKVALVCKATDDAVAMGAKAGDVISAVAKACGGGGGGRPNYAEGAGSKPDQLDGALGQAEEALRGALG